MKRLEGRIAIVTGASTGIGKAIAKKFLEEGAKVAVCSTSQERIDAAAAELAPLGTVKAYACNVANREECFSFVEKVVKDFGRVDILINNAGVTRDAQFYKMTDEQWDTVLDINLQGTYYMTKACMPSMMENKYGKIVSLSSISGVFGNFGQTNYAASKAALIGFTKALAKEVGRFNINANAMAPGTIDTDMTRVVPEDIRQGFIQRIPLKRIGEPEDVANLALFLSSDESSFVTGQCIVIDGGAF